MGEYYSVYRHTTPNGKIYIGITNRDPVVRWRNGTGYSSSPHFNRAIAKFGWENITHEILLVGLTKEEACAEEKRLIALHNSADRRFGYNCTYGGETGVKLTPEVKKKISERAKRFYSDPQHREDVRNRMIGVKPSDETRKKMSKAKIGKPRPHTKEQNQKISEGIRRALEDESVAEKYRNLARSHGKAHSKPVEQYTKDGKFVQKFESGKEAARRTGVRGGNISKCCNGKTPSAGGYIWRYAS